MSSNFNKVIKEIKKKELNKFKELNMQLKYIVEGAEAISTIMKIKLPIVLSFKLSVFVKPINPMVESFGKARNELLSKYAENVLGEDKKPTGQMKFKGKEEVEKFNKEINALLDEEVKVEVPEINIAEFGNVEIEPNLLMNLDWLIKN